MLVQPDSNRNQLSKEIKEMNVCTLKLVIYLEI